MTNTAAETSSGTFDYTYSTTAGPTSANNVAEAKVNAFYLVNTVHDITYRYGFTESAFNFQNNNNG
jgi:extracellular elastinolytic metalloproteinase